MTGLDEHGRVAPYAAYVATDAAGRESTSGESPANVTVTAKVEQDGRCVTVTCTGRAGSHERLVEVATAALRAAVVQLDPPF